MDGWMFQFVILVDFRKKEKTTSGHIWNLTYLVHFDFLKSWALALMMNREVQDGSQLEALIIIYD